MTDRLKIGQEVLIHGYVDEIRKDTIIIRNEGGYFGTVECEITDIEMPDTNEVLDKNKWIPVERELPEKGRQVLCCNEQGSVFTSAITYIKKYKDGNRYVCFGQHCGVVAWMPLPKPYEPQESE